MTVSEREKMDAGEWYCCIDPELFQLRDKTRDAIHEHNTLSPAQRGNIGPALIKVFGRVAEDAVIEAPFHCVYGYNISIGEGVFLNTGCVILDTAPVHIGRLTMLGPNVQIYCAEHHKGAEQRAARLEMAKPVTIGDNVWIGGGAIILAGVSIGDRAIVGAGAVVTKDVAKDTTVVGNPARPVIPRN